MTTILSVHNSEGCIGRCDANCYEASGPDCNCICGCLNHGVGLEEAVRNSVVVTEEMLAKFAKEKGFEAEDLSIEYGSVGKMKRAILLKKLLEGEMT